MRTKRSFLCLMSCLVVLFAFLPGNALAADGPSGDIVTRVEDMEFSSLADAFANIAASDDKTGTVEIIGDIEMEESVTVPDGADIKLIDNGLKHSITMASSTESQSQKAAFIIERGGSLTIDGPNLTFTRQAYKSGASGIIICHGKITLESGTLDFNGQTIGWSTDAHALIQVCGSGAEFVMNGGNIQNASCNSSTGGVKVCCNAKFIMNDGTIQNINGGLSTRSGAVLVYAPNTSYEKGTAYFEMNGGTIKNNKGYRGAGVHVVGMHYAYSATMTMNGGTIQGNICTGTATHQAGGGGIYIEGNAAVTMYDGDILDNVVNGGLGGGVCTIDGYGTAFPGGPNSPGAWPIETYSQYYPAAFTMFGGNISGNRVNMGEAYGDRGCGGGVYVASNQVELKGGYIENNTAEYQGGGVYVGSIPYTLKINNAVVTENTASILGGGVWACPTGDIELFITNGAAVYDNIAEGAGDDIVSVKTSGQDYILTLANRILGGGQTLWYEDGGILADGGNLGLPDDSPRYGLDLESSPIAYIQSSTESYALKAVVSDNAKNLAESSAALFIRGNSSGRGGGIGTNGGIVMGQEDNDYTLKVTKDWGETDESLKTPVTVFLKIGETLLDNVTLSEENGWTAEFTQLPDPSSLPDGFLYTVIENPAPENFEPVYSSAEVDIDTRTITISISNIYRPNGSLTVSKTVSGSDADTEKAFSFKVTLDDASINGQYGDLQFINGEASFTLKHGQSITADGIPAGVGYIVTEGDNQGYTVTSEGAAGIIQDGRTVEAAFNNHRDKGEEFADPDVPQTGDTAGGLFYALTLMLFAAGIIAAFVLHKKKYFG